MKKTNNPEQNKPESRWKRTCEQCGDVQVEPPHEHATIVFVQPEPPEPWELEWEAYREEHNWCQECAWEDPELKAFMRKVHDQAYEQGKSDGFEEGNFNAQTVSLEREKAKLSQARQEALEEATEAIEEALSWENPDTCCMCSRDKNIAINSLKSLLSKPKSDE